MDEYQVIVVGGGVGGIAASIKLAQAGVKVVLVDRGSPVGSKNLSGGVLWGNDLTEILPNWQDEAPIERFVYNKKVGFLSENDATVLDLHFPEWEKKPYVGSIVLRARFDAWLAEEAKKAGVVVLEGINVDNLIIEDNYVRGIISSGEELRAPVTIIMDGANSRLTHELGIRKGKNLSEEKSKFALGVKEVISLDRETLEERFNLQDKEGVAGEFVLGNQSNEVLAGGFLYTNYDSISLGIIVHLDTLGTKDRSYEVFNKFKEHPYISKLLRKGDVLMDHVEYGAHLVPEGGINTLTRIHGNGYMVGGDAAGFIFSNGLVIQGMNYAIKSGLLAAKATKAALDKKDYSELSLIEYTKMIEASFIYKDLKKFSKVHKMTKNKNLFKIYPKAINEGLKRALSETNQPKNHLYKTMLNSLKEHGAGLFTLLKDARGAMRL